MRWRRFWPIGSRVFVAGVNPKGLVQSNYCPYCQNETRREKKKKIKNWRHILYARRLPICILLCSLRGKYDKRENICGNNMRTRKHKKSIPNICVCVCQTRCCFALLFSILFVRRRMTQNADCVCAARKWDGAAARAHRFDVAVNGPVIAFRRNGKKSATTECSEGGSPFTSPIIISLKNYFLMRTNPRIRLFSLPVSLLRIRVSVWAIWPGRRSVTQHSTHTEKDGRKNIYKTTTMAMGNLSSKYYIPF